MEKKRIIALVIVLFLLGGTGVAMRGSNSDDGSGDKQRTTTETTTEADVQGATDENDKKDDTKDEDDTAQETEAVQGVGTSPEATSTSSSSSVFCVIKRLRRLLICRAS